MDYYQLLRELLPTAGDAFYTHTRQLLLSVWSPGRQSVDNSNSSSSQGFFGNLGGRHPSNPRPPSVSWFNLPMDQFGHLTGRRNVEATPMSTPSTAPNSANIAAVRDTSQVSHRIMRLLAAATKLWPR